MLDVSSNAYKMPVSSFWMEENCFTVYLLRYRGSTHEKNADCVMACPQALVVCMAAQQAIHFVGLPEANLALAQPVVHWQPPPKAMPYTKHIAACRKTCRKPATTPSLYGFATPPHS